MREVLFAWIGNTDLKAAAGQTDVGLGPIGQAVKAKSYDKLVLISNYPKAQAQEYAKWLSGQTRAETLVLHEKLSSPTNFGEIYLAARKAVDAELASAPGGGARPTFHLSPGTPAMAAVWIILAKAFYGAELIQSSREEGVVTASVPFDLSAEFIPDLLRRRDEAIERLASATPPEAPEFADIVHRCEEMKRVVAKARRVAVHGVPVLIEGESGTGKELLARAIHDASPRRDKPFVAINCGAIPAGLVESELFGHVKGAFSGATADRQGRLEDADGGTVFLDEVGELPADAQVKLLRVLETGEVTPVGSGKTVELDVRVLAATNRDLMAEVTAGRFREDLFYRLAVAVLFLPPLRARKGDVGLLIDRLLDQVGKELPEAGSKKLSAGARKLMLAHPWRGNVRELLNTLRRAAIWSAGEVIDADEMREALLSAGAAQGTEVLGQPLGNGFNLPETLGLVARHYLERALQEIGRASCRERV